MSTQGFGCGGNIRDSARGFGSEKRTVLGGFARKKKFCSGILLGKNGFTRGFRSETGILLGDSARGFCSWSLLGKRSPLGDFARKTDCARVLARRCSDVFAQKRNRERKGASSATSLRKIKDILCCHFARKYRMLMWPLCGRVWLDIQAQKKKAIVHVASRG